MTLQAGRIYGGVGRLGAARQGGAVPWWLSGGISAANCVGAYLAKGAADYETSKINLATPGTYDLQEVGGALNWTVGGWTEVPGRYFDTGITLGSSYTVAVRVSTSAQSYRAAVSNYDYGSESFGIYPRWANFAGRVAFTSLRDTGVSGEGDHVMAQAGVYGYVDGVMKVSNAGAPSLILRIFTNATSLTHRMMAVAVYKSVLDAAQVAALSAAMAAL